MMTTTTTQLYPQIQLYTHCLPFASSCFSSSSSSYCIILIKDIFLYFRISLFSLIPGKEEEEESFGITSSCWLSRRRRNRHEHQAGEDKSRKNLCQENKSRIRKERESTTDKRQEDNNNKTRNRTKGGKNQPKPSENKTRRNDNNEEEEEDLHSAWKREWGSEGNTEVSFETYSNLNAHPVSETTPFLFDQSIDAFLVFSVFEWFSKLTLQQYFDCDVANDVTISCMLFRLSLFLPSHVTPVLLTELVSLVFV